MSVISNKARTFYVVLPKAACTSVKTMFWELETGGGPARPGLMDRIRARLGAKKPAPAIHHVDGYVTREFGSASEVPGGYERICVVRDPLSRLRSGWSDKVGREVFASRGETGTVVAAGLELDPTFGAFVDNLDRYREISRPARVHSRAYAWHLGADLGWYDQIFPIEEMSRLESYLSGRTGAEIRIPRRNEGAGSRRPLAIEARHGEILRARLAEDYALVGGLYDFDQAFERLLRASAAES